MVSKAKPQMGLGHGELEPAQTPSKQSELSRRSLLARRRPLKGTVYLLLDHSTSMSDGNKLLQLRRGALRFFAEAYALDYAVGAVGFASSASLLLRATRNIELFQKRLLGLFPDGRTAMAHAISIATWRLRWRRGKRVIMLITDGQPNNRSATLAAAQHARALGIELIVVATSGADEAFISSLTAKPELAGWVEPEALEESIGGAARALPS